MENKARNIGVNVKIPDKVCNDKKCPFHGEISTRGRQFMGLVIAKDVHRTATIEWGRLFSIPKFERFEKRKTKIHVHNPPCIDAQKGDKVKIIECRKLSKTKNFVIIENLGKQFGFEQMEEARKEAKHLDKKKEAERKLELSKKEEMEEKDEAN